MKEINKKIVVLFLIFTFVFSPALAVPAQAFWPVIDVGNNPKEYGLDAIGFMLANIVIGRVAASTVNWINSGFKGSPAFMTNPEAFFGNMGDKIAGQFIFSSPNLNFLCGPLQAKIKLALSNSYTQYDRRNWQCSLTGIANNVDAFMNNFENGGWEGFFELSQGPQNPIGAYLQAEGEMLSQIANQKDLKEKDLLQGKGFMSFQKCKPETVRKSAPGQSGLGDCENSYNSCVRWANGNPATAEAERQKCSATLKSCSAKYTNVEVGDCADSDKENVTPGSVISDQLNNVLGTGGQKLAAADEINEIVSALLTQLVNRVIGGIGNGLRGASKPDSSSGGTSGSQTFTTQLTNNNPGNPSAGYAGYFGCVTDPNDPAYDPNAFCDKPNTDVLDLPLYSPECIANPGLPGCQLPDPILQVQIIPSPTTCDPADPSCTKTP